MPKAVKVTTSGEVEIIDLPVENSYPVIRDAVGGIIDGVGGNGWTAYVHDEGLLLGLPVNPIVSVMGNRLLVGDALFVGNISPSGEYDGENYDVPAMLLSEDFRTRAQAMAVDSRLIAGLEKMRYEMGFDLPMTEPAN